MTVQTIKTSQGQISYLDTMNLGRAVVFIHGNSACKEVFSNQFASDLTASHRFIAIDLSGHGESDYAVDKEGTYNIVGYAKIVEEVITKLDLFRPVVVGWSLGGHIALQLSTQLDLAGLVLTGTPPISISAEGFGEGFNFDATIGALFAKKVFTEAEAATFMGAGGFDTARDYFIIKAALKTDGLCRALLMDSMLEGIGGDQKEIAKNCRMPLLLIQGEDDKGIKNSYILEHFAKKTVIMKDCGHATFREKPREFNLILQDFLKRIS